MKDDVFQTLYRLYMKQIYFYLQKTGCNQADAEDIVQDTFAKAIEYFDAIDVSKFRSWLFRVALNQYYDLCRKEKRHPVISVDEHEFLQRLQTDECPELLLLNKEKGKAIANVLSQLKTTEQHLLFMKYELDYSYKDISQLLQLNENTVKRIYLERETNLRQNGRNNLMSEHNEIDELLVNNRLLKKAKRKTSIRNISINIISFFVLFIVIIYTNAQLLNNISYETLREEEFLYQVAKPNTYITHATLNDSFLRGELEYNTHKLLGRTPVFAGAYKKVYSILPLSYGIYGHSDAHLLQIREEQGSETWQYFNKIAQKAMMYYHPLVTFREIAADLTTLDQYKDDALFEVALSFDKGYGFDEINRLLPNEIFPSWYWVDTFGKNAAEQYVPFYNDNDEKTNEFTPFVINPNHIIGFSSIDGHGEKNNKPS